ncbi:hypothetical protein D0N50_11060 [Erwinia billingiae]|nr:hypothetical protein D0N50_11060 [Erwinia billingiae]
MNNLIKRLFFRISRSLLTDYGPSVLTIIFAVVKELLFPNSPLWLIPIFFLVMVYVFTRDVKW